MADTKADTQPILTVPVILVTFNRPDKLARLWQVIRAARPQILYVLSDGPRNEKDRLLVEQCRSLVKPDWPCQLHEIYSEKNLGCRKSQIFGISKVFSEHEQAIIVEDDLIPSQSFFPYCQQLLHHFEADKTIFAIAGTNHFEGNYDPVSHEDIGFSRYFSSTGWATWRRSWQLCFWDEQIEPRDLSRQLQGRCFHGWGPHFWQDLVSTPACFERLDSWAYQFSLAGLRQGLLTVFPSANLLENIGYDQEATHTTSPGQRLKRAKEIDLPVKIPSARMIENDYDRLKELSNYDARMLTRLRRRLTLGSRLRALFGAIAARCRRPEG